MNSRAYELIMESMRKKEFTKTLTASIMGITISKLNYHLDKINRNNTRINVPFIRLLFCVLDIKPADLLELLTDGLSAEENSGIAMVEKFVADFAAKRNQLNALQRTAFYPNKLPASFNTITPDRLN